MANKLTLIKRTVPRCNACAIMAAQLDGEGIEYETIDITETPSAIEEFGLTAVPVMIIREEDGGLIRLTGMQPIDEIKALLNPKEVAE